MYYESYDYLGYVPRGAISKHAADHAMTRVDRTITNEQANTNRSQIDTWHTHIVTHMHAQICSFTRSPTKPHGNKLVLHRRSKGERCRPQRFD